MVVVAATAVVATVVAVAAPSDLFVCCLCSRGGGYASIEQDGGYHVLQFARKQAKRTSAQRDLQQLGYALRLLCARLCL